MARGPRYNPKYENSWALIVGVNAYKHASPLGYACNDATAFADQMVKRFGFPSDNVTILLDGDATLRKIRSAMARLISTTCEDDRVVVFFAGHGHTLPGHRRETGYLVPVGGRSEDISTLLPWDEFVSNSNVVRAKHMLFIMDACYGGLMGMRALAPGTKRFVRDMLLRYSRQVLTAGKADEVVADCGGPRNGHSMFTGHLLDALDGAIATSEDLIAANAVMAYVYDRVAKDPHSQQSPHYGRFDGDGDLFFTIPDVDTDPSKPKDSGHLLVDVPADLHAPAEVIEAPPLLDQVKQYLAEPKDRIRLNDLLMRELRAVQQRLGEESFPVQASGISKDEIAARLENYERAMSDLLGITVLLGRWATDDQQSIIRQVANVLAGPNETNSGLVLWLNLRAYPMLLAMYAGGIAALEGGNYRSLQTLFATRVRHHRRGESTSVLQSTVEAILDANRTDAFKTIPGFEQKYAPQSEYLFTRMQPIVEDILFLGNRYEHVYDRFEILYALNYADHSNRSWGPPGRFAWKYSGRDGENPFTELLEEAKLEDDKWPPLRAGMFRGSYAHFIEVAERFQTGLLNKLNWW